MARRIGLVVPTRRCRGGIWQAREQFDPSPVFRRARDYCERAFDEWYVLSAAEGLLPPRQVVGAAGHSLTRLAAEQRARWAATVAEAMTERCQRSAEPLTYVLFASQRFAEVLARAAPCARFELPLSGMTLRERLRWYDERLLVRPRLLTPVGGGA